MTFPWPLGSRLRSACPWGTFGLVEVTLRASELAIRHLPPDLQRGDGVYTVGFESQEAAFRELLKFGPDAEVLEPPELRERIAATASEVADLYGVRGVR